MMTPRNAVLISALAGSLTLLTLVFYGLDSASKSPSNRTVCVTLNFNSSAAANSYRGVISIDKDNIGKVLSKEEIAQDLLEDSTVKFNIEDVESYDIKEGLFYAGRFSCSW